MAIKKIISIENVGRLVKCTQKGGELGRYNVFFAENGRGKTTLCAVFRSLQIGKHEFITERKTLRPAAGEPAVSIRLDGKNANFANKAWNATAPEIAIFDATFVARNVHAGEYVSRDQRTNLLQVIIGEAGVVLAQKVGDLDARIRDKNTEVANFRKAAAKHLSEGVNLETFLSLPKDHDVDQKIENKTAEQTAAKREDEIKKRELLAEIKLPELPKSFAELLAKSLDGISADAEAGLRKHLAEHKMGEGGEAWLAEGLSYIHDEKCPFCEQTVKELPIIGAYKQFFSDAYTALRTEVEDLATSIETTLGDGAFAAISKAAASNEAGTEFWKQFVETEAPALDCDQAVSAAGAALKTEALKLVAGKISNPLQSVGLSDALKNAMAQYEKSVAVVADYNGKIKLANIKILAKKNQVKDAALVKIDQELATLKLTKLRHDPKVSGDCDAYLKAATEKDALDKEKDAAKTALDAHSDKMIQDYEATINKLLKGFGAGFLITNSKKTYIGGTPTSTYQILINNHAVDLGDSSTPLGQPSFGTTLSSGDKSTLALAFFLAQLDHDASKANKVVIFDDPFNSQDRSRRERTAELLKKCGSECQQLLLLSHDPFFLHLVYSKCPTAETRALQLSRVADNNTTIEEWDVEKETQEGYFKDHAALSSYMLNGANVLIDIARKIRPVLEGYLRYRFPHQFPDKEWLGDMIKRIRDSNGIHPMSPGLAELEAINDYSKKYHHDTNPGKADSEPLNDGELQSFVSRTLAIAGGY